MFHVVSIQESERIIKELKPLLRTKAKLVKTIERKYDEFIEDTQKALDQKILYEMPEKTSPPKVTNPTPLGIGESSRRDEESEKERKVDKQLEFFISSVSISLDTSLYVNDPFQENLDHTIIV